MAHVKPRSFALAELQTGCAQWANSTLLEQPAYLVGHIVPGRHCPLFWRCTRLAKVHWLTALHYRIQNRDSITSQNHNNINVLKITNTCLKVIVKIGKMGRQHASFRTSFCCVAQLARTVYTLLINSVDPGSLSCKNTATPRLALL